MSNIPINCVVCPYESRCNTGYKMIDCHFYYVKTERLSLIKRLKNLFGKVFK